MNKKLKNILAVTGAVTAAAAAMYAVNALDEKRDRRRYLQSGRMVEVRGRRMHVYTCGAGSNTLVLLTGQGTPTPSIDFRPLIERLQDKYRIAVPEPFGYGYSDKTGEPRTVKNVVDELREGLRKAGVLPPYVLTGHAQGGVLTLYWAAHYPREVAAVVGLDTTLPAQEQENGVTPAAGLLMKAMNALAKVTPLRFLIKAGIMDKRLAPFTGGQSDVLPILRSHLASARASNCAVNELTAAASNCAEVAGLNYPVSCPVLMLVSGETCDALQKNPATAVDWLGEHEKIAMHAPKGKCSVLEGGHYLHHTASEAIAAEILDFVPPEEPQTPKLRKLFIRH
ncbi:MAG: alpha/beta hydrolase [Ruminococcaceae bacterium]|jgi:pimeloyl-ACP methyl ester carboxylesterase|nr:alpha/beta hydrolase [Oscillospiraceae bacterium]